MLSAQISYGAVALSRFGQEDMLRDAPPPPPQGGVTWNFRELGTVSICLNQRKAQLTTGLVLGMLRRQRPHQNHTW